MPARSLRELAAAQLIQHCCGCCRTQISDQRLRLGISAAGESSSERKREGNHGDRLCDGLGLSCSRGAEHFVPLPRGNSRELGQPALHWLRFADPRAEVNLK